MKGVICYDSVYSCTKQVAEALAEQLKNEGNAVVLINMEETKG